MLANLNLAESVWFSVKRSNFRDSVLVCGNSFSVCLVRDKITKKLESLDIRVFLPF